MFCLFRLLIPQKRVYLEIEIRTWAPGAIDLHMNPLLHTLAMWACKLPVLIMNFLT